MDEPRPTDRPAAVSCPTCAGRLERLGGSRQKLGKAEAVEIVHYLCGGCARRWMNHSVSGWRETTVDLNAD